MPGGRRFTTMRAVARWVGRIFLGVVALVVGLYVVQGVVGTWEVRQAKAEARESVRTIEGDTTATDAAVDVTREALGEPVRSWSQVVCTIESHDAGWIVQDYVQRCSREVVDIHRGDLERRAEGVGEPDQDIRVEVCADRECVPEPVAQVEESRVRGAGTAPDWGARAELGEGSHTVVTVTGPATEVVLGCSPWGVVFCTVPVDGPVTPEE